MGKFSNYFGKGKNHSTRTWFSMKISSSVPNRSRDKWGTWSNPKWRAEIMPVAEKYIYHDPESLHWRWANALEPPSTAAAMKRIHFWFSTCPSTTQETSLRCTLYINASL